MNETTALGLVTIGFLAIGGVSLAYDVFNIYVTLGYVAVGVLALVKLLTD